MITLLFTLIFLLFFVLAGFFSGIETGLISLDRIKLFKESKDSNYKKQILKFSENPDKIFGTTLIGTNISIVIVTTVFTIYFIDDFFRKKGIEIDHEYGTLILSAALLLFAELIPKAMYRDNANALVTKTFSILQVFYFFLKPAVKLVTHLNNSLASILKIEDKKLTREDISFLLSHTKNDNSIQKEMLEEALSFNELKAKNVMIPRTDMIAINDEAELEEILELAHEKGFTRFPVYHENPDEIVGILILYDILKLKNKKFNVKDVMREPFFAPESMSIDSLLREMQTKKKSMSIVVDAYGGTAGLITMEDILEEIVGEIEDEYDTEDDEQEVKKVGSDIFVANASVEIDYLNDQYDMNLPEGDYETLAGLIIFKLAKIPKIGYKFTIGNWDFSILQSTNKKIEKVQLKKKENI